MKSLYLIDASGYLFRAYYALPPMSSPDGQATHAVFGFIRSLLRMLKDFAPQHIAAIFDAPGGKESRLKVFADYKAHRGPAPDDLPQQVVWAHEFCLLQGIPVIAVPGVEADDAIGTITQWAAKQGAHVYICTSDKDLYQLVGDHVTVINTFKNNQLIDACGVQERLGVPPEQVVDLLALMGDKSDNIPGVTGIGIKTAASLLEQFGSLENILSNLDQVKGKKRQETLLQEADTARLGQQLATLDLHVQCPTTEQEYALAEQKKPALRDFFRDLGFQSLLKELVETKEASEPSKAKYTIVDTKRELQQLVTTLSRAETICFDTETTSLHPIYAEVVGIGFGLQEGQAWYVPCNGRLGREAVLMHLQPLFENSDLAFYGHNIKYDLHVLKNYDITVNTVAFDTIVASYLLNSQTRRHSLDALTLHYFERVKTPIKSLIGSGKSEISMMDVPIEKVGPYCCEDVDDTICLKEVFAPQLKKRNMNELMEGVELPLIRILMKMERKGVFIDVPYLKQLSKQFTQEIKDLAELIYELAGETFNLNSPKQLSRILFEKMGIPPRKKTATGHSTRAEILAELAQEHKIAEVILRYRTVEKLRSTYVDTLPEQVHPTTGRVHTTFLQHVAATGRLASQDPNLQNIPIRTPEGRQIRGAFRPSEPDWSYLSADYSQIELRLLAHLSGDERLIDAFHQGQDIHAHTASVVFKVPLSKVTQAQRRQAKAVNFGIIYGQQAYGLSRELGIDLQGAGKFITTYFSQYPKVHAFIERVIEEARQTGEANTILGRKRLIPEINSRNAIQRRAAQRLAINTPLQGSAADLIKVAMIRVDQALTTKKLRASMLLQIHDELIFESPDSELDALETLVREAMEEAFELSVPLPVDVSIGKNWKEC